jgi:hypothetical protein
MMGFVCATAAVGIARNIGRVAASKGLASIARVAPLVVFDLGVLAAAASGALSPVASVIVGTAGNVFFGLRSLAKRTAGAPPVIENGMVVGSIMMTALVIWTLAGRPVAASTDVVAATTATLFFGAFALANAREAHRTVLGLDRRAALSKGLR